MTTSPLFRVNGETFIVDQFSSNRTLFTQLYERRFSKQQVVLLWAQSLQHLAEASIYRLENARVY